MCVLLLEEEGSCVQAPGTVQPPWPSRGEPDLAGRKGTLCDPKAHLKQWDSPECQQVLPCPHSRLPRIQEDFILNRVYPLLLFLLHKMGITTPYFTQLWKALIRQTALRFV